MQTQNKPYYLEHLISCTNRMLYYRDVSTYLAHNRTNSGESTLDKANNKLIDGNIGCLIFTSGDRSYGIEWVAASFNAKKYLAEVHQSEGGYVLIEPQGNDIRCRIGDSQSVDFPPLFSASQLDRTHDSEYLLLNFLGWRISSGKLPNSGRLSLITERIPCSSCTAVICKFVDMFKDVTLDIFYMHDTTNCTSESFFSSIAERDIRLLKVAFHTVVDLIEVIKNPRITLSSRAREQGKMFGGAPNQILQAVMPHD